MKKSQKNKPYKECEVSRWTFPAELQDHLDEEEMARLDLRASVPGFIKYLNEEIQYYCPGAVADLDVEWDDTDDNKHGSVVTTTPAWMNEQESREKSDALASAMCEMFINVKLEYDWEIFR